LPPSSRPSRPASLQGALAARQSRALADAADATLAGLVADAPKKKKGGAAPPEPEPPLISHANVNPGSLAGAVVARVHADGAAQISAIGPQATYLAARAVIHANEYMGEELKGKVLAILPSKHQTGLGDITANLLEVHALQDVEVPKNPDATVASLTPVRQLALYLSKRFEENEEKVTLSEVQSKSINVALKAAGRAEPKLAVIPSISQVKAKDSDKTITRMMLTCVRAPQ